MSDKDLTIRDRLEVILESIELIQDWSKDRSTVSDYMDSATGVMAFNACVMRFQVIGEHVGKLLKEDSKPLESYKDIPWPAIYGMRNIISHEYANIDEELIISAINDDLIPLKSAIKDLMKKY